MQKTFYQAFHMYLLHQLHFHTSKNPRQNKKKNLKERFDPLFILPFTDGLNTNNRISFLGILIDVVIILLLHYIKNTYKQKLIFLNYKMSSDKK